MVGAEVLGLQAAVVFAGPSEPEALAGLSLGKSPVLPVPR